MKLIFRMMSIPDPPIISSTTRYFRCNNNSTKNQNIQTISFLYWELNLAAATSLKLNAGNEITIRIRHT